MNVFIVDDEQPARERLKRLLSGLNATVCGEADNGVAALAGVQNEQPDVVLLDVRMPQLNGIEVARRLALLATPPAVIFTTAYDDYAIDAFDASATSYLLKPIRREQLDKALTSARSLNRAQLATVGRAGVDVQQDDDARSHLCVRLGHRLELIAIDEIVYFLAEQKYVTVRHAGGEAVIEESLKALELEFGSRLLRVHRNALVCLSQVAGMEKNPQGRYQIVFRSVPDKLEVSRRLVAAVRQQIRAL